MTSADTVRNTRGYHRMESPLLLLCFLLILIPTTQSIDFGRSPCEEERYKAVFGGGFLPSCSPQGLFEPVQCKDDECWCVVKDTGEEIAGTRIKSPEIPNCDYPAIAANEADLIKAVIKNKGDDIVLTPDSFNGMPSYVFQSSSSVYAMSKDYLPPSLWSDFSILATIKPESLEGGFLFAVVDYLESGIQFGLGISPGSNEYTQHIDLWYSEDAAEKGSTKIAQFTVPVMMGRWSRFAIGVNGTSINLHLYCQQNYAREEYKRSYSRLKFMEDSYLLVGHGGDIFNEQFKGQIQELRITNDPLDAEKQCEAKEKDSDEQLPGMEAEFGSGAYQPELGILDPDSEPDLPDEGSGALPEFMGKTIGGFDPNAAVISSTMMPADPVAATESPYGTPRPAVDVTTMADIDYTSTVLPRIVDVDGEPGFDPLAIPGVPGEQGEPGEKGDKGDIGAPGIAHMTLPPPPTPPPPFPSTQSSSGEKGDKGDAGLQGMSGQHGVNGIPGLEGPIGPPGLRGEKGEKGEVGVGEPGTPGLPGQSTKGEPGADGMKGEQGAVGRSIQGPPGLPGSSFFAELEDLMIEGSGEEMGEEIFTQIPALRHLVGEKGEPGNCTMLEGLPGREGLDGVDGTPGLPGAPGPRGQAGERGTVGIQGPRGEDGAEGRMGEAGAKGDKGSAGERGAQGLQGPPGVPAVVATADGSQGGATGKPGTPGQDGTAGEQGERGEKGEKGISGEKGSRGFDGQEGPQGVAGLDGVQGEPGLPGATGAQGPRGEAGAQGAKGDTGVGLPGPPGLPGATSTTGKPFFGNLVASSGDSGAKGAKGEPGATGSVSVNDIENILPMFTEKGDKGDEGDRGKDGGCKMCVGFKGQRGPRGRRGKPGKPGLEGPKGSIGTIGLPGSNGIPGTPGSPGVSVKGEKGDTTQCDCSAAQGSKGAKGEPGMVMSGSGAAANLVQGPPGPPGPPGEFTAGPAGPPGPRGYPGRAGNGRPSSGGSSIGNVVMFATQHIMSSSSLAIPSGTLGFVMDQQRLYIRVNLGWQALSLGPVIPMTDGEFANEIPDFLGEFGNSGLKDQAAATGTEDFTGVGKTSNQTLRIYALNEPLSGSEVVGVGGADHMCYKQAKRARVSGTYRAVLTSRLQRIDSLVFEKDRDLSIVNSRGERILDSWSGVTRNKGLWVQGVPIYSFDGKNIHKDDLWHQKYFWHGARSSGEADTDAYCEAWTSGDRSELGLTSSYMSGQVLDKSMHTCDSKLAVLCIETTVHETYRQR